MKLHEELQEASVAATGHHADLLRRAAEYVAACDGQDAVAFLYRYPGIRSVVSIEKIEEASDDGFSEHPLYLHPSPPPAGMQITEADVQMLFSIGHYMTTKDESPRCGGDLFGLARRIEAMLKAARGES